MSASAKILGSFRVRQAMRGWVGRVQPDAPLAQALRRLIKFKLGALLVGEDEGPGLGVIYKSDFMTCYYGGLPLEEPVDSVMVGPPEFIEAQVPLDQALTRMQQSGVHRLYVGQPGQDKVEGYWPTATSWACSLGSAGIARVPWAAAGGGGGGSPRFRPGAGARGDDPRRGLVLAPGSPTGGDGGLGRRPT